MAFPSNVNTKINQSFVDLPPDGKTAQSVVLNNTDGGEIDETNPIPVSTQFGIPTSFTKQTSSSVTKLIQKGQLNHYRQRPAILNEHVETARQAQSVVTSTNEVGQIFKASQDNINSITVSLESAQGQTFDDFESYADSAALQAAWIASDPTDLAKLELAIVPPSGGDQSMLIPADGNVGNEWAKSFSSVDFSDYIGEFDFYSNKEYKDVKMRVFVEDSIGNTNSTAIVNVAKNSWEHIEIDVNKNI